MTLVIKSANIQFERTGRKEIRFDFPYKVKDYGAALKGFEINYSNKENNIEYKSDHAIFTEVGIEIDDIYMNDEYTMIVLILFNIGEQNSKHHCGSCNVDITVFADIEHSVDN